MNDKIKQLEYSSFIIGSRKLPSPSLPLSRASELISAKAFSKKHECPSAKISKVRNNRIRNKNQHSDIFLAGEQVAHLRLALWQGQMDSKYLESFKEKMRKSSTKTKGEIVKILIRKPEDSLPPYQRVEQFSAVKVFSRKNSQKNMLIPTQPSRSVRNERVFVGRARVETKVLERGKYFQNRVQQVKNQQINWEMDRHRKQLFYINQKDLSGIHSESFIVLEYPSGQIVTGYYYRKVYQIASLTKIMTFFAIMRLLEVYSVDANAERIQIDENVAEITGTSAELYEGDNFSLMQLIYAMMLPSGNDAALALAKWGGQRLQQTKEEDPVKLFIGYMNKVALQLGMKSSTFGNPHGLPHPQNGSTAEDLGFLINKCLDSKLFCQVVKTRKYRCTTQNNGVRREVVWENTNKLLRRKGFEGIKTGVTTVAGPCLATLYRTVQKCFIVVLLRTNKLSRRFKETRLILSMTLRRLGGSAYSNQVRQLMWRDVELDSDNSQDEMQFNYQRNDAYEFERRKKILLNQL